MSYAIKLRTDLAETRLQMEDRVIRVDDVVSSLHIMCDPHRPADTLPVDKIVAEAKSLRRLVMEIRNLRDHIQGLKRELGEEDG